MTVKKEFKSMRNKFGDVILEISKEDPRVYGLDGDLANSTKLNILADKNPDKFLQMGIAEQNMMGVGAGLAAVGLQPWAVTFAAFITKRSLDQIQVSIAQTNSDVKMVGAYAGLLNGRAGKTHQALEDLAIMRSLSKMVVLAPADAYEVEQVMRFANKYQGPVYIRLARDNVESIFSDSCEYRFELGKAVVLKEGADATIISTGTQTARALEAANLLHEEGINASVVHMPSIKPLDNEAIIEAAKSTRAIVTTEEHTIYGGLGSAVAEVLVENVPVPMLRVGVRDKNTQSGSNEELLDHYEISSKHVAEKVLQVIQMKK
ncbi:transketolase family protein [Oceanobacillus jeddahense]|uniref:transketolase family protein n=1 Tax=Oceanobacillus jeddahense TaxID=1462527 RepID=UPI000595CB3E|nr:transketolase C-terminal domain-containing protein [Oceanobacillus jeddahense]